MNTGMMKEIRGMHRKEDMTDNANTMKEESMRHDSRATGTDRKGQKPMPEEKAQATREGMK